VREREGRGRVEEGVVLKLHGRDLKSENGGKSQKLETREYMIIIQDSELRTHSGCERNGGRLGRAESDVATRNRTIQSSKHQKELELLTDSLRECRLV